MRESRKSGVGKGRGGERMERAQRGHGKEAERRKGRRGKEKGEAMEMQRSWARTIERKRGKEEGEMEGGGRQ